MATFILCVTAIITTTSFLILWFWVVYQELRAKMNIVNSAENQLAACRKNHMHTKGGSEEQDAKSILSRSLDIHRQSVILYNKTLLKPWNLIPGLLMGFRKISNR